MMNLKRLLKLTVTTSLGCVLFAAGCDRNDDVEEVETTSAIEANNQAAQPTTNPPGTVVDQDHEVDEADDDMDVDEAKEQAAPLAGKPGEKIAKARCEREQKCGNLGAGKDYKSMDACVTKVTKEWRDDLNKYECPDGVVEKELSECLEEVRNEDCGNPFDTLGRVVACRASDICS